ncbi:M50 family metallopeptidase [Pengzhenrongella frigida]|uniref:M50 family metallopeptidase n=1 Tax=Pengzhenrongella frigida TaxID=1259133 RepID=UPI001F5D70D2|nr:M50 family metallopeptidase [Cellulomonas sp. HLT2-17]
MGGLQIAAFAREVWDRITSTQPAPSPTVILATAGLAALLVLTPRVWPFVRHAITLVHEGSHATVAVLTGRRLAGIRLHSDTSGLTVSVGRPRGPGMVATAAAGYLGPGVLGLGAAWLTSRGHAVAVLWVLLLMLVGVLIQIRNWFGLWSVLVTGSALVAVTWWAPEVWQSATAYTITWFLLLGATRPVLELLAHRGPGSDADVLARLTHLPALGWVLVFGAGTVGAAVLGGSLLLADHVR